MRRAIRLQKAIANAEFGGVLRRFAEDFLNNPLIVLVNFGKPSFPERINAGLTGPIRPLGTRINTMSCSICYKNYFANS